jgi:hypothetical protein
VEGISTIAGTNRFLPESCLPKMNAGFGRPALSAEDVRVSPEGFNLNGILCMEDERKAGNDYIIRFHARLFQILPEAKVKPGPGNTVIVRTKPDNSIEIIWKDKPLPVKEVNTLFNEYNKLNRNVLSNLTFLLFSDSRKQGIGVYFFHRQGRRAIISHHNFPGGKDEEHKRPRSGAGRGLSGTDKGSAANGIRKYPAQTGRYNRHSLYGGPVRV